MHTQEWPDIVMWSNTVKRVIIVELTVPSEENMEEACERKKLCYENLRMECEAKDGHVKWCPLRLVVVASSVEKQPHTWAGLD